MDESPLKPSVLSSPAAIPAHSAAVVQLEGPDPAPVSLVLPGSGFPPRNLSSAPRAAPHPDAHARLWLLISAVAAIGFYPPATTKAVMSPLYPVSARGKGWDGEGSSQTCSLPTQLV